MVRALRACPVVLSLLACTGVPGASSDNRAACHRYVDHMNALEPCLGLRYDAANLCQEVDATPVAMAPYYECLVEHSACDGTRPRLDVDRCEPPVLDLVAFTQQISD